MSLESGSATSATAISSPSVAAVERLLAEGADGTDDAATQRILGLPSKTEAKAMAAAMAEAILDCAA